MKHRVLEEEGVVRPKAEVGEVVRTWWSVPSETWARAEEREDKVEARVEVTGERRCQMLSTAVRVGRCLGEFGVKGC